MNCSNKKIGIVVGLILFGSLSCNLALGKGSGVISIKREWANDEFLLASREGNLDGVMRALCSGADLYIKNDEGKTAFDLAHNGNHWEVVDTLCNAQNNIGNALLLYASAEGNLQAVIRALCLGANVYAQNSNGKTAFDLANGGNHGEIVDVLCAAQDNIENTVLLYAAAEGDLYSAMHALCLGADLYAKNSDGKTAFELANKGNHGEIVDALCAAQDNLGNAILLYASAEGSVDGVMHALSLGANLYAKNSDGETAFELAHGGQHWEVVDALCNAQEKVYGKKR